MLCSCLFMSTILVCDTVCPQYNPTLVLIHSLISGVVLLGFVHVFFLRNYKVPVFSLFIFMYLDTRGDVWPNQNLNDQASLIIQNMCHVLRFDTRYN